MSSKCQQEKLSPPSSRIGPREGCTPYRFANTTVSKLTWWTTIIDCSTIGCCYYANLGSPSHEVQASERHARYRALQPAISATISPSLASVLSQKHDPASVTDSVMTTLLLAFNLPLPVEFVSGIGSTGDVK